MPVDYTLPTMFAYDRHLLERKQQAFPMNHHAMMLCCLSLSALQCFITSSLSLSFFLLINSLIMSSNSLGVIKCWDIGPYCFIPCVMGSNSCVLGTVILAYSPRKIF